MEKTSTTSRCLTYTFLTDEDGFKTVRQASRLKLADTVGYHQDFVWVHFSTALYCTVLQLHRPAGLPRAVLRAGQDDRPVPAQSVPPLYRATYKPSISDPVGRASFVVLDTDYTSRALVCSCQVGYWSVGWSDDILLPGG